MQDINKKIGVLFEKSNKLDTKIAVGEERDKALLDKMDELYNFFKEHDKNEMKKYDKMSNDIIALKRIVWMIAGVLSVFSFIGFDNIITLLRG